MSIRIGDKVIAGAGLKGKDGVSPVVEITEVEGGHQVSITDVNGVKSFEVKDGAASNGSGNGTVNAYSKVITGDGSTSVFTINHNLATLQVVCALYDKDNDQVITDIKILDDNNISVIFDTPPSVDETYTVVVI